MKPRAPIQMSLALLMGVALGCHQSPLAEVALTGANGNPGLPRSTDLAEFSPSQVNGAGPLAAKQSPPAVIQQASAATPALPQPPKPAELPPPKPVPEQFPIMKGQAGLFSTVLAPEQPRSA